MADTGSELRIDFRERLERARQSMAAVGVDALTLWPSSNMRYMTGYVPVADERLTVLIITADGVFFIVPKIGEQEARKWIDGELFVWSDDQGFSDALRSASEASRLASMGTVAVDDTMRSDFLLALQSAAPTARYTVARQVIGPLRIIKSRAEVELLRRSAKTADVAMQAAIDTCRVGATELEVASAVERAFVEQGVETVDFKIVASGPNGASPHHEPTGRRIQAGDPVVIDIGATLDSYHSDITRTVVVGEPDAKFVELYRLVLEAQTNAIRVAGSGQKCSAVDAAARDVIDGRGYGARFIHRLGHGIGLDVHEAPWLGPTHHDTIESGMAFSIEPGVYLPGEFGIRIEDIVVATEDGNEDLTGYPRDLIRV